MTAHPPAPPPPQPPGPHGSRPSLTALEWRVFKRRLLRLTGFDLEPYKDEQTQRRVAQWMERAGIASTALLLRQLQADPSMQRRFLDDFTINTSQFLRDPGVWLHLERQVIPELLAAFGYMAAWSAGCSNGAEPYSLAVLLHRMGHRSQQFRILATDIDEEALAKARRARYTTWQVTASAPDWLTPYFEAEGAWLRLSPEIAGQVRFRRHNLLQDDPPGRFHLILCRYVMIYLSPTAQGELVARLRDALLPGGYLVVGGAEPIHRPEAQGLERSAHCIYRRR